MNIVCTLTPRVARHAGTAAGVLAASTLLISNTAAAQDATPVSRATLPIIEWSVQPTTSTARSRLVVSLRATPASRASMFVEQAASPRPGNSWLAVAATEAPSTRVGLELRSASTEKRLGFNNVLKMQLSGGSTLLLKPRRSGVAVTWRAEF